MELPPPFAPVMLEVGRRSVLQLFDAKDCSRDLVLKLSLAATISLDLELMACEQASVFCASTVEQAVIPLHRYVV